MSQNLPWMNHGKVPRNADAMMNEADATAAKVCNSLHDEHEYRAKSLKKGKMHKRSLKDTAWVERHHKDVLTRHCQPSWYIDGVVVRKIGQEVHCVLVGNNKILDRDHTRPRQRTPDPSGRVVTFEFAAADPDWEDDSEEDDCTAEPILTDKPDPLRRGGGFTWFIGKDLPLCGTHGSRRAVLCRGTPRCGWTTSRKRGLVWMSRMCWCI